MFVLRALLSFAARLGDSRDAKSGCKAYKGVQRPK